MNRFKIPMLMLSAMMLSVSTAASADVLVGTAKNHQIRIIDSDNGNKTWSISSHQASSGIGFYENASGVGRMLITAGGRVGIGTTSPNHELVIRGNDPVVDIHDSAGAQSTNAARLRLLETAPSGQEGGGYLLWNGGSDRFSFGTYLSGTPTATLVIDRSSNNVGIGTQNLDSGDFKLVVNGAIRAKEIIVETGWSDFVFDADYRLAPLSEVSAHINDHGRLPGIPSAAEIARSGVPLGEMQSKLLMKVEELTLHIIRLEDRLAAIEGSHE